MIALGGATSFFVGNAFQAQMPEYAHDLGADEAGGWYSVLLAGNAAGAILGAMLARDARRPPPQRAGGHRVRRAVGRDDRPVRR